MNRLALRPCLRPHLLAAIAAGAIALLSGCAPMATYNPAYVGQPAFQETDKVDGRVLVYTERVDDDTPFVGPPTSFTGGGTKLTIPLGVISREIAATVFGAIFKGGATKDNVLGKAADFRVVIKPKVSSFSYEYNQLKNLGFAITPTVVLSLQVATLATDGSVLQTRSYDSGTVEMPAYIISGSPGEEIGKAAHKALFDLMTRAAIDVRDDLRKTGGPAMAL